MSDGRSDLDYMQLALQEAARCEPVETAFCVGCVIVVDSPSGAQVVLATGYSRELPGNTHAEANALAKALELDEREDALRQILHDAAAEVPLAVPKVEELLKSATVYTTLEPCSVRTSGLAPCADALVHAKVRRVVIGVGEPKDFVVCEGAERLKNAEIEVEWLKGLEENCLVAARRSHPPQ
ncbi:diaminohydroxyphosphoribosylamino-pyrimidine deaminase [Auriculariales sp. MPI-PUGE-AT-0066]|nr:diaminohydroxyphosphoribosylamino-pyrimidine deaminase [Auriculariales sp. MPI-PUGE-AT-0066]